MLGRKSQVVVIRLCGVTDLGKKARMKIVRKMTVFLRLVSKGI